MPQHKGFVIDGRRVKTDGFLRVDEVAFQFRRYDGNWSGPQTHEVMHRGDAVAVLPYDRDLRRFVLVEQFRVATVRNDLPSEGRLLEICAGGIEQGETALDAARRELYEETGYDLAGPDIATQIKNLERFTHVATVYPSPGGSTERIHIYVVHVRTAERSGVGGGSRARGEDVRAVFMAPSEIYGKIDAGELMDAKLIAAVQWYRTTGAKLAAAGEQRDMPAGGTWEFTADAHLPAKKRRRIGIKTGDIGGVYDVDIWVNSENTDMLMDRFFGTSISARIRNLGADRYLNGTIYRDTVAEALRAQLGGEIFVKPSAVIVTGPGALSQKPFCVRKIFHAAAVQGSPRRGLFADPGISAQCVENALLQAKALNDGLWFGSHYRSILIPMLGTGQGKANPLEVARLMVDAATGFMKGHGPLPLSTIYFLAFSPADLDVLSEALQPYLADKTLKVPDDEPKAPGEPPKVTA